MRDGREGVLPRLSPGQQSPGTSQCDEPMPALGALPPLADAVRDRDGHH